MKVMAAVLVVLLVGSVVVAQKTKDPGIRTTEGQSRANRSAYKSTNSDAVAASLKKNSSAASQLAQIEHQNKVQSGRASAHAANAALPKAGTPLGKNKTVKASYKSPQAGGRVH